MHRVPRVEQAIQETIAMILQQEMKDPRVSMVTVTRVRATADLQHAVVYFSVLGGQALPRIEAGLKRATPYVRRLIGERLRLRWTPELRFQYDPSIEDGIRWEQRLRAMRPRLAEAAPGLASHRPRLAEAAPGPSGLRVPASGASPTALGPAAEGASPSAETQGEGVSA